MASKTLINGTAYEIKGGKTLVGGTAYEIESGKTLVGGTAYEIGFVEKRMIDIVHIAGGSSSYYYHVDITIDGVSYDTLTFSFESTKPDDISVEMPVGAIIYVRIYNRAVMKTGTITVNGTVVATAHKIETQNMFDPVTSYAEYNHTVTSNTRIEIGGEGASSVNMSTKAIITEY